MTYNVILNNLQFYIYILYIVRYCNQLTGFYTSIFTVFVYFLFLHFYRVALCFVSVSHKKLPNDFKRFII